MEPTLITVVRFLVLLPLTYPLYRSQRYWGEHAWRLAGRVPNRGLRLVLRAALALALVALVLPGFWWIITGSRRPVPQTVPFAVSGLWLSSAFFAWLGVKLVNGAERLWNFARSRRAVTSSDAGPGVLRLQGRWRQRGAPPTAPPSPSRRYFFQTASYLAGAVPFVGSLYGFAVERLHYRVERVEIPIPDLPAALDGLRIGQLSDIHIGGYMSREQVRRAVEMANELAPELFVVTGDFITGRGDPLADCIEELGRLRAPLGVWGCNGNHEIYAGVEDTAARLFQQAGMRMLRKQNAEVDWRGAKFNLLGVDHQITRGFGGHLQSHMLSGVETLVRPGMANILLSHNPNAFYRAAELGIDLTIAGHTHGGQIQVEIIDSRLNPARFMTEFVAGLYQRPVPSALRSVTGEELAPRLPRAEARGHSPVATGARSAQGADDNPCVAHLYVNRGLGTIGTPVRIGSPPEITLLVLRRA